MKDLFINYKQLLELKELGLNLSSYTLYYAEIYGVKMPLMPMYQQVFDWALEEHNVFINFEIQYLSTVKIKIINIDTYNLIIEIIGNINNYHEKAIDLLIFHLKQKKYGSDNVKWVIED